MTCVAVQCMMILRMKASIVHVQNIQMSESPNDSKIVRRPAAGIFMQHHAQWCHLKFCAARPAVTSLPVN